MKIQAVLIHNPFKWTAPDTWLYSMIRFFTKSKWNHIVLYVDIEGVSCVCDANFHGVIIRGNKDEWYNKLERTIAHLEIPIEISEVELVQRLIKKSHKKYDYLVYLYYAKYYFSRLIRPNKTVFNYKSNDSFYCFELVASIYKEVFQEQLDNNELITAKNFEKFITRIEHISK